MASGPQSPISDQFASAGGGKDSAHVKHLFKYYEYRRTIFLHAANKDWYGRHRGQVLYGMKLVPNGLSVTIGPGAIYTPYGTKIFVDVTEPPSDNPNMMMVDLSAMNLFSNTVNPFDPTLFQYRPIVVAIYCKFANYDGVAGQGPNQGILYNQNGVRIDPATGQPFTDSGMPLNLTDPESDSIGGIMEDTGTFNNPALGNKNSVRFEARPITWNQKTISPDLDIYAQEPIFMSGGEKGDARTAPGGPHSDVPYSTHNTVDHASRPPLDFGAGERDNKALGFYEILLGYVIIGTQPDQVISRGLTVDGAVAATRTFHFSGSPDLSAVATGQTLWITRSTNGANDKSYAILAVDNVLKTIQVEVGDVVTDDSNSGLGVGIAMVTFNGQAFPTDLGTVDWAPGVTCIQALNVWEALEDFLGSDVLNGRSDKLVISSPNDLTAVRQNAGVFNLTGTNPAPGGPYETTGTLPLSPRYGTPPIDPATGTYEDEVVVPGNFRPAWTNYRLPSFLKDGDSLLWVMRRLDYYLRLWMDRTGDQELVNQIQDGVAPGQEFMSPLNQMLFQFDGTDIAPTDSTGGNANQMFYGDRRLVIPWPDNLYPLPAGITVDPFNITLKSGFMPHFDKQTPNINTVLNGLYGDTHLGSIKALETAVWVILTNILGVDVVRSLLRTMGPWDMVFWNDRPINLTVQPTVFTGTATNAYIPDIAKFLVAIRELIYRSERNAGDNLLRNHAFWAQSAGAVGTLRAWNLNGCTAARRTRADELWSALLAMPTGSSLDQWVSTATDPFNANLAGALAGAGNLLSASITLANPDQALRLQIIGWDGAATTFFAQDDIPISANIRTVSLTARIPVGDLTPFLIFRLENASGGPANVEVYGASLNAGMPNADPVSRIASDFLSRDGGPEAAMRWDMYMGGWDIWFGSVINEGVWLDQPRPQGSGAYPLALPTLSGSASLFYLRTESARQAIDELAARTDTGVGSNLLHNNNAGNHPTLGVGSHTDMPPFWSAAGTGSWTITVKDSPYTGVSVSPQNPSPPGTPFIRQQTKSCQFVMTNYIQQVVNLPTGLLGTDLPKSAQFMSASAFIRNTGAAPMRMRVIHWNSVTSTAAFEVVSEVVTAGTAKVITVSWKVTAANAADQIIVRFESAVASAISFILYGSCLNVGMPNANPGWDGPQNEFLSRIGGPNENMEGPLWMGGNQIKNGSEATEPYDFVTLSQLPKFALPIGGDGSDGAFEGTGQTLRDLAVAQGKPDKRYWQFTTCLIHECRRAPLWSDVVGGVGSGTQYLSAGRRFNIQGVSDSGIAPSHILIYGNGGDAPGGMVNSGVFVTNDIVRITSIDNAGTGNYTRYAGLWRVVTSGGAHTDGYISATLESYPYDAAREAIPWISARSAGGNDWRGFVEKVGNVTDGWTTAIDSRTVIRCQNDIVIDGPIEVNYDDFVIDTSPINFASYNYITGPASYYDPPWAIRRLYPFRYRDEFTPFWWAMAGIGDGFNPLSDNYAVWDAASEKWKKKTATTGGLCGGGGGGCGFGAADSPTPVGVTSMILKRLSILIPDSMLASGTNGYSITDTTAHGGALIIKPGSYDDIAEGGRGSGGWDPGINMIHPGVSGPGGHGSGKDNNSGVVSVYGGIGGRGGGTLMMLTDSNIWFTYNPGGVQFDVIDAKGEDGHNVSVGKGGGGGGGGGGQVYLCAIKSIINNAAPTTNVRINLRSGSGGKGFKKSGIYEMQGGAGGGGFLGMWALGKTSISGNFVVDAATGYFTYYPHPRDAVPGQCAFADNCRPFIFPYGHAGLGT